MKLERVKMSQEEKINKIVERLKLVTEVNDTMTVKDLLELVYKECAKNFNSETDDFDELSALILTLVLQE